ncbi:hypothetical protein DIPPA_18672 [Diplonema papillatum]|nr:hypothetical protein DIPPA_18672 [Diplonema papillatum]
MEGDGMRARAAERRKLHDAEGTIRDGLLSEEGRLRRSVYKREMAGRLGDAVADLFFDQAAYVAAEEDRQRRESHKAERRARMALAERLQSGQQLLLNRRDRLHSRASWQQRVAESLNGSDVAKAEERRKVLEECRREEKQAKEARWAAHMAKKEARAKEVYPFCFLHS